MVFQISEKKKSFSISPVSRNNTGNIIFKKSFRVVRDTTYFAINRKITFK